MSLQRIITDDKNIQLIQDNVASALTPLQNGTMASAVLIKGVVLKAGQDNIIQHNLKRTPQIFFIGNLNANTAVWTQNAVSLGNTNANTLNINLRCTVNCTVALWIN